MPPATRARACRCSRFVFSYISKLRLNAEWTEGTCDETKRTSSEPNHLRDHVLEDTCNIPVGAVHEADFLRVKRLRDHVLQQSIHLIDRCVFCGARDGGMWYKSRGGATRGAGTKHRQDFEAGMT